MANPQNGVKIVLGGPITSLDDWSIGIFCASLGSLIGGTQAELNTIAGQIRAFFVANVWRTGASHLLNVVSNATKLVTTKAYAYNGSGTLVQQGMDTITAVPGGGTSHMPAYCAMVASLHTAGFGKGYRGRSYLPCNSGPVNGTDGLYTLPTTIAADFAGFLTAINGGTYTFGGVPLVLAASVWSSSLNVSNKITSVSVDNIPDTQRGRISKDTASANQTATV